MMDYLISKDAECIILACTELPIAFKNTYYKNIEIIDPANILVDTMISKI